jgi:hypothetical protein
MSSGFENDYSRQAVSLSHGEPPFKTLRILSVIITIFAILAAIGTILSCISVFRSSMLIMYGSLGIIAVGITALAGGIVVIFLLSIAETIKVFLAIEQNTRTTNDWLRKRSMERQEAHTQPQPASEAMNIQQIKV